MQQKVYMKTVPIKNECDNKEHHVYNKFYLKNKVGTNYFTSTKNVFLRISVIKSKLVF